VLLVFGSATHSFGQISAKEFTSAKAKILSHVKQKPDETLYFEVSAEELTALGDSGKILSLQIFQLIYSWGEIAREKDSLENDLHGRWTDMPFDKSGPIAIIWDTIAQKDSALTNIHQTLMSTRKQFADLLWLKVFKFPTEMRTFEMSVSTTKELTKKTPAMSAYLDFIWTFDGYCGERLKPKDGARDIVLKGTDGKVVLVF
jgi:hypothetical protein